jgi:hypothetical protein
MFIVECEGSIYGAGNTEAEALTDARQYVEVPADRVAHISHPRQYYPAGCVAVWPATEQLIAAVRRDSNGIRWSWNYEANATDLTRD